MHPCPAPLGWPPTGLQNTIDWATKPYIVIMLDWDYDNHTVDLSLSGYIDTALQQFKHPHLPQYGVKVHMT